MCDRDFLHLIDFGLQALAFATHTFVLLFQHGKFVVNTLQALLRLIAFLRNFFLGDLQGFVVGALSQPVLFQALLLFVPAANSCWVSSRRTCSPAKDASSSPR